jgi:uncharacterized membrane protein
VDGFVFHRRVDYRRVRGSERETVSVEAARVWDRYLVEWTAWNTVRTFASLATTAGLIGGIAAA